MDDVVVIGYGSQRKSDLTGGIVAVGEEKLQMVTTNNLMDKLAGQIPGMNVTTSNAKPGEDQSLRVRGENSLSADNSPLIVMDGIPYSGSLGDIDPDIIENMSVLKDASSAAIYGSRGANGVILIQTKKGKKGAPTVSYKGQVGMQQAQHRIDMMKGAEYVKYTQDYNRMKYGYSGDQLDPLVLLNPSERANYQNGSELDWQDIMFRNALTTSHQISISGGTDATTYMASISHLKEDGVMENTGLKRTNIALNITQVLNKWLTVGMGTQAVQKEFGGEQPYLEAGLKMSPYGIYKDEEGRYVDYPMDQTCCGQPMANAGFEDEAARLALRMEEQFKNYDYVVGPSASCVAFVKENHPHILEKRDHVCMNSKKIYDICEFLHDVVRPGSLPAVFPHKVSIHNSCHGVRELHLSSPSERNIPYYSKLRDLLSLVKGIEVFEPKRVDECCGFGGMFAIEEPEVSTCMGQDKVKDHMSTGAEYITGADSSCLMHMGLSSGRNFRSRLFTSFKY